MTPHNEANPGDYAETVLMPGDPLRAAYIAQNFFENPKQVNGIRNCLGFTGHYKGHRISTQASGMGQPSLGIYATELFDIYGVKQIIRIGTCGSFQPEISIGDLIVPMSASSDSHLGINGCHISPCCSHELLNKFMLAASNYPYRIHAGSFFASDNFYNSQPDWWHIYRDANILGVDMETYYLYLLAMIRKRHALTVNMVADNFNNEEKMSTQSRVELSRQSVQIVLDALFPA